MSVLKARRPGLLLSDDPVDPVHVPFILRVVASDVPFAPFIIIRASSELAVLTPLLVGSSLFSTPFSYSS
jgi:hypothetical protein